ncbi:conserved exported protein of unknown function [Methylotuvimicrobium alcaliphilum 20Z]|uniref:Lipoprotein n=2 Tax=Methylotuvimicrobium alcaliphilum TaxID=271065 RepID=G4STC1_META2|nr:conserved exported protein of unknown function [Methylotuvimicrobium alcaliphilum 20Z]
MRRLMLLISLIILAACGVNETAMNASIQEVKNKHQPELLQLPGVVSVGIGLDEEGRQAIIVGLAEDNRNDKVRIPETIEGYSVKVQVVGTIKAQ